MNNYLDILHHADKDAIRALRDTNDRLIASQKKGIVRFREPYEAIRHLRAGHLDLSGDAVTIGTADELGQADQEKVEKTLRAFMPWRKGPWSVFGIDIDAEWRSFRKWDRLLPELPDLTGKIIADIGSNNGYYMFRMAAQQPKLVLGFEPYLQHYFAFQTLNQLAGLENLHTELLGVEHLGLFENSFDVIFLMGILYHRISPIESLREIHKAMRPGGTLIVESQAIPGEESTALFPEKTYAKVPGTWFVPTGPCLANWLKRAGFQDVKIFCSHPMNSDEQRKTDWMTFESYSDFIDPADPGKTIEGYPAPLRVFVKGISRGN